MSSSETIFATAIGAARDAALAIPDDSTGIRGLDDTALLRMQRELSELRLVIDARATAIAGEVAFRSRRELGYTGLARRQGFGTAEKLIQAVSGSTSREASTLVAVGTMVRDAQRAAGVDAETGEIIDGVEPLGKGGITEPWLDVVGVSVALGELSIEKARAIKAGLGELSPPGANCAPNGTIDEGVDDVTEVGVTVADLADAAMRLVAEAGTVNADQLYQLARQYRDELDFAGIAVRERAIHEQRAFRRTRRPNGLPRFTIDPDIETSAYFDSLYDILLSPRRGGPRFVDPDDRSWAEAIEHDERTNEQYLHDAFAGLLRLGVDADTADRASLTGTGTGTGTSAESATSRRTRIVGSRIPAVRVLTTEQSLTTRLGIGRIEGSAIPVSIDTVERAICTSGTLPLHISQTGQVLDLGREVRLFTSHQKIALAARDGGCLWPGCDKPPAWTEAHHIDHWARDHGRTDVRDGVLLCRYHHLLLHNNHWEIKRHDDVYILVPPPEIDPRQRPRRMHSKSAVVRDLKREQHTEPHRKRGPSPKPPRSAKIRQLVS